MNISHTLTLSKKGFSLIEMLLVLGVLAVLLIAAFVIYPKVRDQSQARNEATNILAIQTNVRNLYANKGGNYTGLGDGLGASDNGISNQARVFPPTMNGGDYSKEAKITSSWGANVVVWKRPQVTTPLGTIPANRSFGILYANIPPGVCVNLLPALSGSFHSVTVGNLEAGQESTRIEMILPNGQINVNAIGDACKENVGMILTSM